MKQVSSEQFSKMTDVVLDSMGTPSKRLFEYPYRADESRNLIAKAEATVNKILAIATEGES